MTPKQNELATCLSAPSFNFRFYSLDTSPPIFLPQEETAQRENDPGAKGLRQA